MRLKKWLCIVPIVALCTAACTRGQQSASTEYETKSSRGEVSFQLTPQGVEAGRFFVKIRADTHSGDLSEIDLSRAITLRVGEKTFAPAEASTLRGHHSSGSVEFELETVPETFAISINGVRSMQAVELRWP